MGWWTDLFKVKDVVTDSGLPRIQNPLPIPKVKPCKPEKDISEPVISFVGCVRNNPKRFSAYVESTLFSKSWEPNYHILDKKTKEFFVIQGTYPAVYIGYREANYVDWLTKEEKEYVIKEIDAIYQGLVWRKLKLEGIRKDRKEKQERSRLTDIYKESE